MIFTTTYLNQVSDVVLRLLLLSSWRSSIELLRLSLIQRWSLTAPSSNFFILLLLLLLILFKREHFRWFFIWRIRIRGSLNLLLLIILIFNLLSFIISVASIIYFMFSCSINNTLELLYHFISSTNWLILWI
jgi:hypothetical protein